MRSNSTPLFISCMTLKKLFNFVTLDMLIYKMDMILPSNLTVLFTRTNILSFDARYPVSTQCRSYCYIPLLTSQESIRIK